MDRFIPDDSRFVRSKLPDRDLKDDCFFYDRQNGISNGNTRYEFFDKTTIVSHPSVST